MSEPKNDLAQGIIDALPEPAFLLSRGGDVLAANRAARGLLGPEAASGNISDRLASGAGDVARYLTRARTTTSPLPGALTFRTERGEARFRVHCARLASRSGAVTLMLRCSDSRGDRFSVLAERVRRLDSELRQRVREKAVLREALDENRNLLRELQHRVKNNIQMMISLLSMSAANNGSEEVRRFVAAARDRFRALATTQDLIYEAQSTAVVPARQLFGRLADAVAESTDRTVRTEVDLADVLLPQESAHCLALIANELITNSLKHGLVNGSGRIRIGLGKGDTGQLRLVVQDDGRGYPPLDALPRSSGLTLIRGLCRQIGASLELGNDSGAKSVVIFRERLADAAECPEEQAAGPPDRAAAG